MNKEERLLKQAKQFLSSAMNILEDETLTALEPNLIRNAAQQATQAATELNQLFGMLGTSTGSKPKWPTFKDAEEHNVSGRGKIFSVRNPEDATNFSHLQRKIVEVDGNFYFVSGVEYGTHFDGKVRKGELIGLVVRTPTPAEVSEFFKM